MALSILNQINPARPQVGQEGVKTAAADVAARLPALLLAAERIAATIEQGVHGRRRTGPGEVFWQYRPYSPGDELRRLDWRASARSDRLFLRQHEWSASQSVYLWCDLSPSMEYASRGDLPAKSERALVLTLALATVLARAGERVGLLGHGEPPRAGRGIAERLAERLFTKPGSPARPSLPPAGDIPAHSHAVLMSDFLTPLDELRAVIGRLAQRGVHGHLVQVLDPAEKAMPFKGRIRFLGPEQEGELLMSRAEHVRDQYLDRLAQHQAGIRDLARHARWSVSEHVTDMSDASALLEVYQWLAADQRMRR